MGFNVFDDATDFEDRDFTQNWKSYISWRQNIFFRQKKKPFIIHHIKGYNMPQNSFLAT